MSRSTHPKHYRFVRPAATPADVSLARVPPETRAAVRAALAARLADGEAPAKARYAVARQFCLTVLMVEAVESAGGPSPVVPKRPTR